MFHRLTLLLAAAPACAWMIASQQPQAASQLHSRQAPVTMVSRRKAEVDKEVDATKLYEPKEAIALLQKCASAKFVETAELHGNLNLDPKYNDQQIRTTVSLPHGTGKNVRVAVRPALSLSGGGMRGAGGLRARSPRLLPATVGILSHTSARGGIASPTRERCLL